MRAAFDFCVHWHYKVIQCTLSCHTELVFWWIWVRYRRRQNRIFSEVTKLNRIRLVIRCFGDHLRIWAAHGLATCWYNRHHGAQKHLPLTYNAYHREHWRTMRITGNTGVQCVSQGTLTYSAYHREHWHTVRITGNTGVQCVSQGTLTYSAYHREHWRTVRITENTGVQCVSQGTLTYSAYHREHKCSQFLQYFSGHMLTLCAHFLFTSCECDSYLFFIQDFLS